MTSPAVHRCVPTQPDNVPLFGSSCLLVVQKALPWISAREQPWACDDSKGTKTCRILNKSPFLPTLQQKASRRRRREDVVPSAGSITRANTSLPGAPAASVCSRKPGGSAGYPSTGINFCCLICFNRECPVGHNLL